MYTYLLSQNNESNNESDGGSDSDDEVLDPDFDKHNNEDRFVSVDMVYSLTLLKFFF